MTLTRYTAAWVLPVSSPPISDGAVLVADGRIVDVGPSAAVPRPEDAEAIDLGEAILLPGLINVHAHPELSVLRGALEDLPFHLWIPRLRRIRADAGFCDDDWRDAARWTCAEAAAAGITTIAATEDSDAAIHALRDSGLRGISYREVFGPTPGTSSAAIVQLRARIAELRLLETDLVQVGVSPHAPYSVADDLFREVADYARSEALRVAVHVAESEAEQQLVVDGEGPFAAGLRTRGIPTPPRARSPVALLEATGILAGSPLLIHCVRVDAADIVRMADAGARVAHCPVANARLGHGVAPAVELMTAGVTVGIGTDSVASNNRIDLLEEARTAQLMQRARLQSAAALDAEHLLRLVTIEGARVLGIDDRVGTLEPGRDADLCAVALTAPHARPSFDPVSSLFMSARGSDVVLTVVRGRVIYHNGMHRTQDVAALGERVDALGARIRTAAAAS